MRERMEQVKATDQNLSETGLETSPEAGFSKDPELGLLYTAIAALRLQEQQLNVTCASLLQQNDSLDQAINALDLELAQELELLKQVTATQTLDPRPMEVLAMQIYSDKLKSEALTHQEEALKQQFLSTSTSNTQAEQQIYELDDLVWKKSAELKELKTQVMKRASVTQLRTALCKSCVQVLDKEQKLSDLQTDISSIASTPIRRQSSMGAKLHEAYSL